MAAKALRKVADILVKLDYGLRQRMGEPLRLYV